MYAALKIPDQVCLILRVQSLKEFAAKFEFFVSHVSNMDELFEASFTKIESTEGSSLRTKCGKCRRFMKSALHTPLYIFFSRAHQDQVHSTEADETVLWHLRGDVFSASERQDHALPRENLPARRLRAGPVLAGTERKDISRVPLLLL